MNKEIITHEQYHRAILSLEDSFTKWPDMKAVKRVYGVPRGGMYPAAKIAADMGWLLCFDPKEIGLGEDVLIVDDLIDSGETMARLAAEHPKAKFAVVYDKCARPEELVLPQFFVGELKKDTWLVLPDEHDGTDIEDNFRRTLQYIGEDVNREGLLETPRRMKRAYDEIFSGYRTDPKELVKTFVQGTCKEMVILKRCEFYSTCEHHFFPFFGHCSIGYLPNDKVIGVSKLARLLDCFAKRMQIQERMTAQIADFLMDELGAKGVYVVCEGVHFCMTSRGIKKQDASMVTSAIRGVFENDAQSRAEFLQLIRL